jgi:proline iminopeptidase
MALVAAASLCVGPALAQNASSQNASAQNASSQPAPAPVAAPADPYGSGRKVIADLDRIVTPNGVQESFAAPIGGIDQWISVRGADRNNPILLFIHGGPGSTEMPMAWTFERPWEDYFTVVQWDQRAAGKTFAANAATNAAGPFTLDRYVDDTIQLIEFLRKRYGKRKIIVVGHSWGSVLGLSVAAKRPDLVQAYVGIGQVIDFRENERLGYDWVLAHAKADHNATAIKELESLAPYPGPGPLTLERLSLQRKWSIHYGGLTAGRDNANYYFDAWKLSPEYSVADEKAADEGSLLTITRMLPVLTEVSFKNLHRVKVPVHLFLGRNDATTPPSIAEAWLARLDAPSKSATWFEHSAHLIQIEEPGHTLVALLDAVGPKAAAHSKRKAARRR